MLGPREVNQKTQRDLASLAGEETIFGGFAAEKLKRLQAELEPLSRRYDVVVANPPYMGSSNMNGWLSGWVKERFPDSKRDLCTCFIERGFGMLTKYGYSAMVTMESWMFLSSFERMRKNILHNHCIATMVYMNHMVMRIAFNTCATIFANHHSDSPGLYTKVEYQDLTEDGIPFEFPVKKHGPKHEKGALEALANPECGWFYRADASGFEAIPGSPISYWASNAAMGIFSSAVSFGELANPSAGITTGDNASYIHYWWEEEISNISFTTNDFSSRPTDQKWFPCNKGGAFRKWYGNRENVMAFDDSAINAMRKLPGYRPVNIEKQFKASISWSDITSGRNSFRANGSGNLYDHVGISAFPDEESFNYLLAFLNTSVASTFMILLAPTLHCNAGDLAKLPIVEIKEKNSVNELVNDCIKLCRRDWDAFELSWAFRYHPMI